MTDEIESDDAPLSPIELRAAAAYNAPPAIVPRDAMWTAIHARRTGNTTSALPLDTTVAGVPPITEPVPSTVAAVPPIDAALPPIGAAMPPIVAAVPPMSEAVPPIAAPFVVVHTARRAFPRLPRWATLAFAARSEERRVGKEC